MATSESGRRTFHTRLNEMVRQLREAIETGIYSKGHYLPTEKSLAEQYKLSNKTVRKGLELLSADGYIEKIPRVGSLVVWDVQTSDATQPKMRSAPAVTLLLGCYSNNHSERDFSLSRLLQDFHELHPNIQVEPVKLLPENHFVQTLQPCLENGLIDLFFVKDRHFNQLVHASRADWLDEVAIDMQTYPFLNRSFQSDARMYARPMAFAPLVLVYNVEHFRDAGVMEPDSGWTWTDAVAQATRLSIPWQRNGLHFNVNLNERWPVFLLQGQASLPASADRSAAWLKAIRLMKGIIRNQDIFPDTLYSADGDVGTLFLNGRTSMIVTAYDSLNRFAKSDMAYDISSLPAIETPCTLLNATGVAVNKQSVRSAEARLLADYLTSPRAQRLIREYTLTIPAHKPSAEAPLQLDTGLNRPSRYALYRDIVPSFRTVSELGLASETFQPLHEAMKSYWTDLIDEAALYAEIERLSKMYAPEPAFIPSSG